MVAQIARTEAHGCRFLVLVGDHRRDGAEFLRLGWQCTGLHSGNDRLWNIKEMNAGLSHWMDEKGYKSVDEIVGRAVPKADWQYLNLNYITKAALTQKAVSAVGAVMQLVRIPPIRPLKCRQIVSLVSRMTNAWPVTSV